MSLYEANFFEDPFLIYTLGIIFYPVFVLPKSFFLRSFMLMMLLCKGPCLTEWNLHNRLYSTYWVKGQSQIIRVSKLYLLSTRVHIHYITTT